MSTRLGIAVLLIYTFNKLYLKTHTDNILIQNHLNDVLAGVLLLCYINALSIVSNQPKLIVTRLSTVALITLSSGLFWEYITPLYLSKSVSDPLDVIAYIVGGVLYWILTKKEWTLKRLRTKFTNKESQTLKL